MTVVPVPVPVKELQDVLDLAKSTVHTTIRELKDGFQVTDLIPIVTENVDEALRAFEGSAAVADAFKLHLRESIAMVAHFVVDVACDILKIGFPTDSDENAFKETKELIAAVSGLTASIIEKLPGGFQLTEAIPVISENFQTLITGIDGAGKIGSEFKADTRAFLHLAIGSVLTIAFDIKEALEKQA